MTGKAVFEHVIGTFIGEQQASGEEVRLRFDVAVMVPVAILGQWGCAFVSKK
ncbi:MAG: hypothetical protein Q8K49_03580 [Brevundimonas sp.]|nr:hypothetical protein [Brevundimonas sp.]